MDLLNPWRVPACHRGLRPRGIDRPQQFLCLLPPSIDLPGVEEYRGGIQRFLPLRGTETR
jgi:hypothetical protein